MAYYPKSQIKENQYTNGGEFIIVSTQENYMGYYWLTSKGEYFTGKTPEELPTLKLQISSKLTELEKSSTSTPIIEPFPKDYYIVDDSYYQSKGLSSKRNAPAPPIQSLGKPSNTDIQNGFFNRYFIKKGNNRYEYPFTARQFKCSTSDDLNQKLLNAQNQVITNIENAQLHESGMEL